MRCKQAEDKLLLSPLWSHMRHELVHVESLPLASPADFVRGRMG
jgi:hypothetical protein